MSNSSRGNPDVWPLSVVIPTYNRRDLLPRALMSALSHGPAEVVIVDDGSTDGTGDVVRQIAAGTPCKIVYEVTAHQGVSKARNRGIELATGEYIAFLDSDDTWASNKVTLQREMFEREPSLAMTFTGYVRRSGPRSEPVQLDSWDPSPEKVLRQLMNGCCINASTVIVRRATLAAVGPFDPALDVGEDWDMWLRIAAAGHRIGYLAMPLADYQWHTTNMSRDLRQVGRAADVIFPRLFKSGTLPPAIQRLERRCLSRWGLINACYCLDSGDLSEARRHIVAAMRRRPASIRLGWVRLLLRTLVPKAVGFERPIGAPPTSKEE